jgi:hypothetical protein
LAKNTALAVSFDSAAVERVNLIEGEEGAAALANDF